MKRHRALMSGLVLATALVVGEVAPAQATFPGRNGRIVFEACNDVACQIYTANPDGTALRQVTHRGNNFLPGWSPSGRRIIFLRDIGGGFRAIWIADADGTNARRLTPNAHILWPAFTPDGKSILFTQFNADGDGGIYSVRTDGTHLHAVLLPAPGSGQSINITVAAPSGRRLAFMDWGVNGVVMGIYTSRTDGSQRRRVTPPRLEGWDPDWRPDGNQIAFTSNADRPGAAIYAIRPDGGGLQQLTHPSFPHADWNPAYSPDGNRILFSSDRRYDDLCCGDLFVMNSDGTGQHRVRLPFQAYDAAWGTAPLLSGTSVGVTAGSSRMSPPWSLNNRSNDWKPFTWMQGSLR